MSTKSEPEHPDLVGAAPESLASTTFQPYIPAAATLPELRPVPIILGTILGMIFGASSLYLVLKVGLGQAHQVADALRAHGFRDVTIRPDLAGIERVVEGTRS